MKSENLGIEVPDDETRRGLHDEHRRDLRSRHGYHEDIRRSGRDREGMGYHQEIGHRTGIVARIPMSSPHTAAEAIDPIVIYNPPPNSQFNYEVPNLRSLGYLVEFVIFFNNSFDLNIS